MNEKKEINDLVGSNIQRERRKAGYTQNEFSELIDVGPKFLSSVERGVAGISLTTMKKICMALSISSDALLFESSPKNDVQSITERLERLTPEQFAIARDVLGKVIEAFSVGNPD